jgi:hypothetical protein
MLSKRGQVEFSPAIFVALIIVLLLMAPIMMRIIGTVTGTFFTQMNTSAPSAVAEASGAVDKVYNFFDYLVVISMFINMIVLFISAWFIDTNPVFIILYIMFAFIFILFLPNMMDAVDQIWEKSENISTYDTWGSNDLNLTYTDWIRSNMVLVTLVVIVLTGIIMYAKFKLQTPQY